MKRLSFPSAQAAEDRSRAEAIARGCDPNGVTLYWWSVEGADLMIPDADVPSLTADEQARLAGGPAQ